MLFCSVTQINFTYFCFYFLKDFDFCFVILSAFRFTLLLSIGLIMKNIIDLLGRIFLSVIFYFEAFDKIFFRDATCRSMSQFGITWNQDLLIDGSAACLILGATLILIGYRAALGAWLILLYWIPLTIMLNKFWLIPMSDHETRRNVSLHFMKNMAIVGGLLQIIANGVGSISVRKLLATTKV